MSERRHEWAREAARVMALSLDGHDIPADPAEKHEYLEQQLLPTAEQYLGNLAAKLDEHEEDCNSYCKLLDEAERPYPDNPGATHYEGCWRERGHHNCALAKLDEAEARVRWVRENLRDYWTFSDSQQPTSSWHDREDFLQRMGEEIAALSGGDSC